MNKPQWNSNRNTKFFIHENAFENVVYEMVAILSRGRWVKMSFEWIYYIATATGYSWTTKVVYLLVKKWWKIKNFRHPLIGCFTFLPLFLQSALSLSVSICLGWRMPSSAGWFSGNTLKTLITEPSIISKFNVISIPFSIYLYSHNMISYTNIYMHLCLNICVFLLRFK